jgi:hypothetical protein
MICVDDDGAMVADVETKTLCTNGGWTWVLKPGDWAFVDDGDDNINGNLGAIALAASPIKAVQIACEAAVLTYYSDSCACSALR